MSAEFRLVGETFRSQSAVYLNNDNNLRFYKPWIRVRVSEEVCKVTYKYRHLSPEPSCSGVLFRSALVLKEDNQLAKLNKAPVLSGNPLI